MRCRLIGLATITALIAALAGCGGSATTRTITTTTTASTEPSPASTTTTTTPEVPQGVIATAMISVGQVECPLDPSSAQPQLEFYGSGFTTDRGFVTAAHVVSTCLDPVEGAVVVHFPQQPTGQFDSKVDYNDPTHDLALLGGGLGAPLEPAAPRVGEHLALIGFPGGESPAPVAVAGEVIATDQTVTLRSEEGPGETLSGGIAVDAVGAVHGDSGGPAIDAAGRVVGVIEGSDGTEAFLMPVGAAPW
jgi:S1-C subfamily serine protease